MRNNTNKPLSKATMRLQEQLRRKREVRVIQKRFLIVCEDGKSAPKYFEALKKHECLTAASISVFGNGGKTQPIQVVQSAIERKKCAAIDNSGTEPFDHVWCVIDGDYGSAIKAARKEAKANGVHLAVSTMCFETWVLLHFEETPVSATNCDAVVRALKENHCPKYSKGKCDFLEIVPHSRKASERARKLRQKSSLPEDQNPCSDVYLLIDAIFNAVVPSDGISKPTNNNSYPNPVS
jgi:hypothetical protein